MRVVVGALLCESLDDGDTAIPHTKMAAPQKATIAASESAPSRHDARSSI
jgi:hypothetical protein